jgi:hypothetical protein
MRASRIASDLCLFILMAVAGGMVSPAAAASNQLVRVPQDARTLDAAISRVADGGVVEMAAGTYPSPPGGFFIGNAHKGFTVRAAAGAAVAIDGGGSRKLIRYVNSNLARGKLVTFERITFQNGYSADTGFAGGITLSAAAARFRNCRFAANRAASPLTGGGAVKVIVGSTATFIGCSFDGNSSNLRGGAIVVRDATATIEGGEFTANRTNLAGHDPRSIGGAIAVIDGILSVTGTRFEANEAGWTGGAIYAIGLWDQAGSNVFVTSATFVANQAVPDPCCTQSESTFGGAIHAEDLTTLRVHDSLFALNRADLGGGLDNYRADVEVDGAVFQANQTTLAKPAGGFGGAISALSADSASDGDVNRRPSRLVISQSLIEGGSGVAQAPVSGGCILVAGDAGRVYGGAVTPIGTVEENRAQVLIRGVVFADCDVAASAEPGSGLGGALNGTMIDLDLEDSMILDSDARGTNAGGGALALLQESNARIVRTTFAHDSAQKWGGALFLSGSTVQIDGSRFYADDVVPGISEGVSDSRGAAIYAIPQMDPAHPRNVGGVVANSTFSENPGIPIWDVDPQSGPTNEIRYDGNRFNATAFGGLVYVDTLAAPGGTTVGGLNVLTVFRGARGTTNKSAVPNQQIFGAHEGDLRVVPSPDSVGAAPSAPTESTLAYAWSGGAATFNGTFGLGQKAGLLEVPPGSYTLIVDQVLAAAAKAVGSCTAGPYLCLAGNRFRAEVTWKANEVAAPAQAVSLSGDTGYFWFVDPANVELVVKVLDGRAINGHFWVFYGGLTNLAYTLTITDTVTGAVKVYSNPAGKFASAGDTAAFAATAAAAALAPADAEEALPEAVAPAPIPLSAAKAACAAGPASLCLGAARFQVLLSWKDFSGKVGTGQAVPLSDDTGYFWFTSPDNVEVIVKVLDGRTINGHFWVFYGGLSNLEYTITVIDTVTGFRKTYTNPAHKFGSQGDTSAIPG